MQECDTNDELSPCLPLCSGVTQLCTLQTFITICISFFFSLGTFLCGAAILLKHVHWCAIPSQTTNSSIRLWFLPWQNVLLGASVALRLPVRAWLLTC